MFASRNGLWIDDIDLSQYISEGAEQRVFLKDSDHVIKLNDGVCSPERMFCFSLTQCSI
ncbi:hypothetical protein J0A68_09485 [Algoriphagus sp. H41]|uniref:Uncharacterized protein n=1 Tax=Algoriphagus oliviformis TaxID=2811231 RepID=A0ABS3C2K7_9BACT|nr:hypothetical protein [Algoriphagus oliviformis]